VSTPHFASPPNSLEQQRKLAKDLLRTARAGDEAALARIRAVRTDAATPPRLLRLADAQLAIARAAGFESWPKLVTAFHERDVEAFRDAVSAGNVGRTRHLLELPHVRRQINAPLFDFGQRAAHIAAAKNAALLTVLIDAGADVNGKSDWDQGPFTVLDRADEDTARFLLDRGAVLTPNVAARLGWFDELRRLVDADAALVHARGGDGQQPLHEAKTVAIADFLLDRGAGIDVRCIDHKSTPAQYALVDRSDVCRRLLERGATPDIFMAACLGDLPVATRLIEADPACLDARINEPGYALVPPLSIYCWSLGFALSPHDVARKFGHPEVEQLLTARSSAQVRFINAVLAADEHRANDALEREPSLMTALPRKAHGHLAYAIFYEHYDAAALMLRVGFDPAAPGMDGGNALHAACWVGNVRMVETILARGGVPIDGRDPTHRSTPLGWAAFGSVHRRAAGADYPAIVDRLVAAGADISALANGSGRTLLEMAQGNATMQAALRRHGAT
jgi:ankyrin repeat protein